MIALSNSRIRTTTSGTMRDRFARYAPITTQVVLAAVFLIAGASKLIMPTEDLTANTALSAGFLRFIGVCEVLGAGGLVLPSLLKLPRLLTPLAAAGLVVIMIGAVTTTAIEMSPLAATTPFVVGLLAAYVAYVRRPFAA